MSGPGVSKYADRQIWLPFVNGTEKTIPAMSAVRITGKEKSSGGRTVPKAELTEKDFGYGAQFLHRITYEKDVEPGATGHFCFPLFAPVLAAFDTESGKPEDGDLWGPIQEKPKLYKDVGGYRILGKPVKGSRNSYAILVQAEPFLTCRAKLTETLAANSTANATPYGGSPSELLETDFDFKVQEDLNGDLDGDHIVRCVWDPTISRWSVTAASCAPVDDEE